jgi:hypothetical protein
MGFRDTGCYIGATTLHGDEASVPDSLGNECGAPCVTHVGAGGGFPGMGCNMSSVGSFCTGKSNTRKVDAVEILITLVIS